MKTTCLVADCGNPPYRRGWCNAHYLRWRRHGDPLGGGTARGEPMRFYMEVVRTYDDSDECLTWPFGTNEPGNGRARISVALRDSIEAIRIPIP